MLIFFKNKKVFLCLSLFIFAKLTGYSQENDVLSRFEFSHSSMGSLFKIICYSTEETEVKQTAKIAFSIIDSLNLKMSDYLPESELMKLCRTSGKGIYKEVSEDLFNIISESIYWSRWSEGAFDITIGAYTQLWRRAGRKEILPAPDQLKKASIAVDYHFIKLDSMNRSVLLSNPDMQLDLGGIAKGYAVDRVFSIFEKRGYNYLLVDGGGDIRTGDAPPGTQGWKIALDNRIGNDSIIFISNVAIATSGDLYRFVEIDNIRYSHIINPATGYGITIPRIVTVTAPTCAQADVLASILNITGANKGFELLTKLTGITAMIVEGIPEEDMTSYRYPAQ